MVMTVLFSALAAHAALPLAVPTFNCIGICWKPAGAAAANVCKVRYRETGTLVWRNGLDLWFDVRTSGSSGNGLVNWPFSTGDDDFANYANGWINTYRGSIVGLKPGTSYDIDLTLQASGKDTIFTCATWPENFPIAQTIVLPATSGDSLNITQSGSASGYICYTHAAGGTSAIDVNNARAYCINIAPNVNYIIIDGIACKNGSKAGIILAGGNHDIVVQNCDISVWGRPDNSVITGGGVEQDAGIWSNSPTITKIIIQRNRIHNPRYTTNNWYEPTGSYGTHPHGPQYITFQNNPAGNYVIRYNEFYSDSGHYTNDGIGGGENNSYSGCFNCDSDIYGNYFANCWDDAIEADGANRNNRIWGNFIEFCNNGISHASISIGPVYVFRNIRGMAYEKYSESGSSGARWEKFQGEENGDTYLGGRCYTMHNTLLQPAPAAMYIPSQPGKHNLPVSLAVMGVCQGESNNGLENTISLNNILQVRSSSGTSIMADGWSGVGYSSGLAAVVSTADYDLHNGSIPSGTETNGWTGTPTYATGNPLGCFYIAPTCPGYHAGAKINNFNDEDTAVGVDIGAQQSGSAPMQFGPTAYLATGVTDRHNSTTNRLPLNFGINVKNISLENIVVSVRLPEPGNYILRMCNIAGRVVWEQEAMAGAGAFDVVKKSAANRMVSGFYSITLIQNNNRQSRKLVCMK